MASNETVEEIVKRVRRECNSYPLTTAAAEMMKLVREFQAAHEREIAAKDGDRKGLLKANESLASDNTRLRGELAAKDGEIAELRECLKEAVFVMQTLFDKQMPKWRKALEGVK